MKAILSCTTLECVNFAQSKLGDAGIEGLVLPHFSTPLEICFDTFEIGSDRDGTEQVSASPAAQSRGLSSDRQSKRPHL